LLKQNQLYNIINQKEARLNLDMAAQQRRLAHASKRDSNSMKSLSLLGAVFLPATYLASLFSMTFFNFQNSDGPSVSSDLWIYFVITVPLTVLIVLFWRWWDKRREVQYAAEDEVLEAGIDELEAQIAHTIRQRTLSKHRTWDLAGRREKGE
jgi:hypothetical protein